MPTSFNQQIIEEFRANGGKAGGPFEGGDLLLLTTTGARSGTEHTVPLGYVRDGDLLLVVGSAGGAPRHPAWYHNLLAHPVVRVELGTEVFEANAVPAEGARRAELFELVVRAAPGYAGYQARTGRALPVVTLERRAPEEEQDPGGATDFAGKLVEVHTWLRSQVRDLRAETEAYFAARTAHAQPGDPPASGLGPRLRLHCLSFCQALEFHHTGEDAHVFPALAIHHPHLAGTLDRLGEEHQAIARVHGALVALVADIDTADPGLFRAELARMSRQLEAHLDYEEESLLPVLAEIPWPPS